MIRINEVRIGNWINQLGLCKVDAYLLKDAQWKCEGKIYADPIPLTTDILRKCGFQEWNGRTLVDEGCESGLAFDPDTMKCYTAVPDESGECWFTFKYEFENIKHLHQLQNLVFALTGKEIEFKDGE